uniref:Uncharacterized protein n=1 Tax=Anguilla anguilla TaxID=7936 RepID=A0A0E9S839_ANGAN
MLEFLCQSIKKIF